MKECSIQGCKEFISETFSRKCDLERWAVLRACRCGAYNLGEQKSCTCTSNDPIPTTYWPNLDWWAFGGVEQVILCPQHKREVMDEILRMRARDPQMNPTRQDPGNVH